MDHFHQYVQLKVQSKQLKGSSKEDLLTFELYRKEIWVQLKRTNPYMNQTELNRLTINSWLNLDDGLRQQYRDLCVSVQQRQEEEALAKELSVLEI